MKKEQTLFAFLILLILSPPLVVIFPENAGGNDGYIGYQVCKGCHGNYYESYQKSVHARKVIPGSPASKNACESCHGPGAVTDSSSLQSRRFSARAVTTACTPISTPATWVMAPRVIKLKAENGVTSNFTSLTMKSPTTLPITRAVFTQELEFPNLTY